MKKRNLNLDIIKVIAIFAVVMIHTSVNFVVGFPIWSWQFKFGNIFDSLSRLGVPLFLMVSGALLLDEKKEFSNKKIFKYVINMIILTFIWAFIYAISSQLIEIYYYGGKFSYSILIENFVNGHYHMWYLYMLVGIYLITPFLRKFTKKEDSNLVLLFIFISLICKFTMPFLKVMGGGAVCMHNFE